MKKRLIVGMSGASGSCLAVELLEAMAKQPQWETHLVVSKGAARTFAYETKLTIEKLNSLATVVHTQKNIGANIASGTFHTEGMVIVPCAMKTLAGVAHGYSDNLILRAADVTIKERRKLILITRETPLSPIHLRNMLELAKLGVVIMPPMLTFYNHPQSIQDMTRHVVGKILAEFHIELENFTRWNEQQDK